MPSVGGGSAPLDVQVVRETDALYLRIPFSR
jgi:hypothetical protein